MEAKYNCIVRYDVKVRPTPDTLNTSTEKLFAGEYFQISEIVPDRLDPNNVLKKWGKIFGGRYDGKYTALEYPNNANPISTYTPILPNRTGRKDVNLTVPMIGKFVQIKHDWEVLPERAPRQYQSPPVEKYAFPAIVNKNWGLITKYNGREYDYVDMPESWQWLLWEIWKWSVDDKVPTGKIESFYTRPKNERLFAKATEFSLTWYYVNMVEAHRAFTEAYSPEAGAKDVVTGRNMNSKPYKWLFRTTTGNIGKVIGETATHWKLEALDVSKPAPQLDEILSNSPHLIHLATEVGSTKLPDGRYPVSNFPQAEVISEHYDLPYYGTPIPFLSLGGSVMISKKHTRLLKPGQAYSPYVKEL